MSPILRTLLTHLVTGGGFFALAVAYMASGQVDLYAIWDQANKIYADVVTFIGIVGPPAGVIYGMWKARFASKMNDVQKDDRFHGAVVSPEVAVNLGPKVQSSISVLNQELASGR